MFCLKRDNLYRQLVNHYLRNGIDRYFFLHRTNDDLARLFVHLDDFLLVDDLTMQRRGLAIFLVNSTMSLECEPIGKRCRADVALERFETGMNLFMVLQVGGLAKRRLAPVALVGLFPGVDAPMVPEGGVTSESLIANLTDVRFLATVRSLVIFQVRRLRKLHSTGATFVRLLASVYPGVIFEVHRLRERDPAHVALIVLFARVQLLVRPQTRIPREPAPTGIARKRFLLRLLVLVHGRNGTCRGRSQVLLLAADDDDAGAVALVTLRHGRQVALLDGVRRSGGLLGLLYLDLVLLLLLHRLDVFRFDRGDLRRHQRIDRRVAVGRVRNFANLKLDVTVGRDEDLRWSVDIVGIVVVDASLAANQLWSLALRIILDGTAAGDALLDLFLDV